MGLLGKINWRKWLKELAIGLIGGILIMFAVAALAWGITWTMQTYGPGVPVFGFLTLMLAVLVAVVRALMRGDI